MKRDCHAIVHLFGGPYVTSNGHRQDVPEGSKRLLAFVALRRTRVERPHAAGALWPFGDDERAAGNLRSALWRLRGAGIEVLVADKWSLALADGVEVDVHLLSEWASRLIEGVAGDDDLSLRQVRADALDLLPGWYDDWAIMERERMRQRILHALEELCRLLTRLGRYADAIEVSMKAINAEPLRESAQRALVEAHVSEGNLVEARRTFLSYRRLVNEELGVEPSPRFAALVGATMTHSRAPRSPQLAGSRVAGS